MDLSGTWSALVADDDLRRDWLDESAAPADERWEAIAVPGHWRSTPAFADSDGPLLYRTRFEHPTQAAWGRRRHWLTLDGLFYQGDVWLDGAYVGDTEGYFFPHTYEVTEPLAARTEHLLGVEATCSPPGDLRAKRNLTGVLQHWDCLDPDWNPGGIWRPVRITETGPVCIKRLRVTCRGATAESAQVLFDAELDADVATGVTLRTTVGGVDHELEQPLAAGENQVDWRVTVASPALWWPHALGDQPLHDVRVEVHVTGGAEEGDVVERAEATDGDVGGGPSHVVERRIGLRQVALSNWVLSVNGERLFLKGSNHGPTRHDLGAASAEEVAADVARAREAGLDLLRIHAHVARPELYDAADEAGILLWQDLPLQWGYARAVKGQAVRQAAAAVDLLGHHPSVAVWCGHNEPLALAGSPGEPEEPGAGRRYVLAQELPTWNKTVLDRAVKRALIKADGSRPVIAHSGVLPHPPLLDGTDTHLYLGWYRGEERDLPGLARAVPRLVRFLSEFGAQAVPESDEFVGAEAWPDLDWERLERTHGLQKAIFDERVPPRDFATFDQWRAASQAYQATVIKHHIETLRRLKYRPTGGFAQFLLADGHPAVSWSVLDHRRVPKAGWDALRAACRPVLVVAERPPETLEVGRPVALDVHVVSDLRHPLEGAEVQAHARWAGDEHEWRWRGDVAADDCARVGTIQMVAPDAPGPMDLSLELRCGEVVTDNRYRTTIVAPG